MFFLDTVNVSDICDGNLTDLAEDNVLCPEVDINTFIEIFLEEASKLKNLTAQQNIVVTHIDAVIATAQTYIICP